MNKDRYLEVMLEHRGARLCVVLTPTELGIVYGAIRLMLKHPAVANTYSEGFHAVVDQLQAQLEADLRTLGFTDEEIAFMRTHEE